MSLYFVLFYVFGILILMNLFLAVLLRGFADVAHSDWADRNFANKLQAGAWIHL